MEEQIRNNDEIEIDLREIFQLLLNKIVVIISSFLIGALLVGVFTKFIITPQYTASSMIYILSKTTSITSVADIQIGAQMTVDFATLATSRPVVEAVIEDVGLDMEYEEMLTTMSVENPQSTQILKLSAENADPKLAKAISNAWSDATAERVASVMATEKPTVVERAVVPKAPSSPSLVKNTAIGALLGMLIAIAVIVARYLLDDTIKTEEDIRKYLNLNTLSAIPIQGESDDRKRSRNKKLNTKPSNSGKTVKNGRKK